MMSSFSFVIRDGLERDIAPCMALDCSYETDYVWQMSTQHTAEHHQVLFKTEHLPRSMQVNYPIDARRLQLCLAPEQCFLVAIGKDDPTVLGYLTMWHMPITRTALIQDVVVDADVRRKHMGARLINIAKRWANERQVIYLQLATQTKNYPSILFAQNLGFSFCGYNDQHFTNQDIAVFFGQTLR